jgi:DNA-binding NarL/FixJ family response regulator
MIWDVEFASRGTRMLTYRQLQVAQLVAMGLNNREIGRTLGTTGNVIKNYLRAIFDRTGMGSRLELALWCIRRNWEVAHESHDSAHLAQL